MEINELWFENFRNLEQVHLRPEPGVNLIYGDNAQGKTNLVEGIWLLSGERSFRYGKESDLPRLQMDRETGRSRVAALVYTEGREQELELLFWPRRQVRLNSIPQSGRGALSGKLCCVVFSPGHLALVQAGPAERRAFLDGAIGQLRPQYGKILRDYDRALAQRGSLLRDAPRNPQLLDLLDIWDSHLIRLGGLILSARLSYLDKLEPHAARFHQGISSGKEELELRYRPGGAGAGLIPESWQGREELEKALGEALRQSREEDLKSGSTGAGPHRDDLEVLINGAAARSFASQGQQRSAVLSMKLAECEMIAETMGSQPVVLLDDVMSELDRSRRGYLLGKMGGRQVFITGCDDGILAETGAGGVYQVSAGALTPVEKKGG